MVAEYWVTNRQILPLMDGLDEVVPAMRDTCMARINEFCSIGPTPIVVSCRTDAYGTTSNPLRWPAAVVVQLSSRLEVQEYLQGGGERLTGLRLAFGRDASLRELIDTPLMLDVGRLAYQDLDVSQLLGPDVESRRRDLFTRYVRRMLERRQKTLTFSRSGTVYWLIWLASSMKEKGRQLFHLEDLDRSWLGDPVVQPGPFSGALFGFIHGWLDGGKKRQARVVDRGGLSWPLFRAELVGLAAGLLGLFVGGRLGATIGSAVRETVGQSIAGGLLASAAGIFVAALVGKIAGRLAGGDRSVVLPSTPSAPAVPMSGMRIARAFGAYIAGLAGLQVGIYVGGWGIRMETALYVGVGTAIGMAIFLMLDDIVVSSELVERPLPNAGTWNSGKNAVTYGTVVAFATAVFVISTVPVTEELIWSPFRRFSEWLLQVLGGSFGMAIVCGGLAGLSAGLSKGGSFFVRHWMVRILLWRYWYAPFQYAQFSDYASERLLLCRVGTGFAFVHPLLMEYFASLATDRHLARSLTGNVSVWTEKTPSLE